MDINYDQQGVVSGMLNLLHNLKFATGAFVMDIGLALAPREIEITTVLADAVLTEGCPIG